MSRIAESLKSLKLERREAAARLTRLDRLIGGYEALNQLQPRKRKSNGAGPVKAAARRRRTKKPVARAANLAAAATS